MEFDKNEEGDVCPELSLSQIEEKEGEKVLVTYYANCIGRRCKWYKKLKGKDPQDGTEIDAWDCSISWQPKLHTEIAGEVRGVHAATNSFRNAVVTEANQVQLLENFEDESKLLETDK